MMSMLVTMKTALAELDVIISVVRRPKGVMVVIELANPKDDAVASRLVDDLALIVILA